MTKREWIVDQLVKHGQPVDDATVKMSELLLTAQFGKGQEPWKRTEMGAGA